mgnify:CR=1 FL=1
MRQKHGWYAKKALFAVQHEAYIGFSNKGDADTAAPA